MTDEPKDDPVKKMRKLLEDSSPMLRLPKKNTNDISFLTELKEDEKEDASPEQEAAAPEPPNPPPASIPKGKSASVSKSKNPIFGPPLWNVASVVSLT
ncbi:MAG: hypothetical protein Q8O48_12085, partial [Anaerolineales bacterium]|nr:hypothetical protein [Anaerolineales bacterium]